MSHYVQAGQMRPKVRGTGAVFALGLVTLGIYAVWWWRRSTSELREFESSTGTPSRINPALETALIAAPLLTAWAQFGIGFQRGYAHGQAVAAAGGAYVPPAPASSLEHVLTLLGIPMLIVTLVAAGRLRRNALRCMSLAGLLPEDRPGAVGHYALSFFFGLVGASASGQGHLNVLWSRFPRYYESIGSTREAAALGQVPGSVASGGGFGAAAPGMPMAAAPAMLPLPVAPPATTATPTERLAQLTPAATAGTLTASDAFDYARAVEQVHGAAQAAPWYEYVTKVDPTNMQALFWHGSWLLAAGEEHGLAELARVVADPQLAPHARQQIGQYLHARGRGAEAAQYGSPAA